MISIIIPVYNSQSVIERALKSVFSQTYGDVEVIVIDDGSTDGTFQTLESYQNKITILQQENSGASAARNAGIRRAKGDWIAFLDADDEWFPDKLQKQMAILEHNAKLKWCASNFFLAGGLKRSPRIDEIRLLKTLGGRGYIENYFIQASHGNCHIGTPTVILHRDIIEEVGLFDTALWYAEDTDMWWRILHRFPLVGFCPEPLVTVHLDLKESTLSKRRLEAKRGTLIRRVVEEHLRLSKKHGDIEQFLPLAKKLMAKTILTMLFHGYGQDAKETLLQFENILDWRFSKFTNLLIKYPNLTHKFLKAGANAYRLAGLERSVSRRWLHLKK